MFKTSFLKNRKGTALIWMLMAFTVLMIMTTSIIYISRQDIHETTIHEERLQTYYIALAGIDMTYAALMDPDNSPKGIDIAINKLKADSTPITDSIAVEYGGETKGTAEVSIDRFEVVDADTGDTVYWIRITSLGQLAGKDMKISSTMRINEKNQNQIVREKFSE